MEKNIGNVDKIFRIVIAFIALYLGYALSPWFYIITAIALATAAFGYCPMYTVLKVNTAKASETAKAEKPK